MGYRPPDPNADCWCGLDDESSGLRTAIVCPKHDGVLFFDDEVE